MEWYYVVGIIILIIGIILEKVFPGLFFSKKYMAKKREEERVYICPETCAFFRGEDGCGNNNVDESARYEKEGDHPLCPWRMEENNAKD